MNALELKTEQEAIQYEIDLLAQDQGNHTELSYVLRGLTSDKIIALLAHIRELHSIGEPVTYDLLERAIGEEETLSKNLILWGDFSLLIFSYIQIS